MAALDDSVERLGITTSGLPQTRTALTIWTSVPAFSCFGAAGMICTFTLIGVLLTDRVIGAVMRVIGWYTSEQFASHAEAGWEGLKTSNFINHPPDLSIASAVGIIVGGSTGAAASLALGLPIVALIMKRRPDLPYSLVDETTRVLTKCADAYHMEPAERSAAVRRLDRDCRSGERHILDAYSACRSIPRRSPRRLPARQHGQIVVQALRAQLARVDIDPQKGLKEYGAMLVEIGERYSQGMVGGLLPEEKLAGLSPPSATRMAFRESLHFAAGIVAALIAAVAMTALLPKVGFISEELRPWLVAGAAAVAGILIAGWHRVARIVPLLGP
ncbi:hypothetical protein [Streptomyces sp. NPDC086989]|uniref:hypothetical protein n=1 Tax=Streptomyces sp. NPDC086989 TaxID=3365764 RepID=UPI003806A573